MDAKTMTRVVFGFDPEGEREELETQLVLAEAGLLGDGALTELRKKLAALPPPVPAPEPARCFRTDVLPFDW